MAERFQTLTGKWLGRYGYAHSSLVVPFEADLVEKGGDLSGRTTEPNTFRFDLGSYLEAALAGGRGDGAVNFIKRYDGFSPSDDPVYAGLVNAALTRIEGTWRFPRKPWASGPFTMMRKPLAAARASRRARAGVPEPVR